MARRNVTTDETKFDPTQYVLDGHDGDQLEAALDNPRNYVKIVQNGKERMARRVLQVSTTLDPHTFVSVIEASRAEDGTLPSGAQGKTVRYAVLRVLRNMSDAEIAQYEDARAEAARVAKQDAIRKALEARGMNLKTVEKTMSLVDRMKEDTSLLEVFKNTKPEIYALLMELDADS